LVSFGQHAPLEALPLPAGTRYTENPPQDTIRDLYAQCDLWLCSSRSEGFFLPALEAMACRCPVVSTRVGFPMDSVEDGNNGYLVEVDDHAGLADRMLRVLNLSDADWRKMSQCAYVTASRYSWQDATALLEKTLAAVACRGATVA
jgi:glycosyltransferase involved in cell wall biosynthesis